MPKSNLPIVMVSEEKILEKILLLRGQKVMLDRDLAEMYGVEVKRLNEAVKRNATRFPEDFMFQLAQNEWRNLKSQIATSSLRSQFVTSSSHGGKRKLP
ncbi:MAG TPA: ORF6N domain-containing protein, partial [Hanamia sp.]